MKKIFRSNLFRYSFLLFILLILLSAHIPSESDLKFVRENYEDCITFAVASPVFLFLIFDIIFEIIDIVFSKLKNKE